VKSYTDILLKKKENYVEDYSPMHHGWMGARADLEDEANAKEFVRGLVYFYPYLIFLFWNCGMGLLLWMG